MLCPKCEKNVFTKTSYKREGEDTGNYHDKKSIKPKQLVIHTCPCGYEFPQADYPLTKR